MGLPEVVITFQEESVTFIHRLGRGVVAIPVISDGAATAVVTATSKASVDTDNESLKSLMTAALEGGASKAIGILAKDAASAEAALAGQRFNWVAIGELKDADQTALASWAKSIDYRAGRSFIVVGGDALATAKDAHVVAMDKKDVSAAKASTAYLAGVLAGCGDRSGTFYVVDTETDGTGYADRAQAEAATDAGKICIFYDGEKAKIGRAVTTVYAQDKTTAFAKVRAVDSMNAVEDDIRASFEDDYAGQVLNSYDNKMNFVGLVNNVYLKGLEGSILDPDGENSVDIDVAKHEALAREAGKDVSKMTTADLRKYPTGESVYLAGSLRLLDTMEDLNINFVI